MAWALIGLALSAWFTQGKEWASTKADATRWGALIGGAAFAAWLAVAEEEAHEAEQDAAADDARERAARPAKRGAAKRGAAKDKTE